MQYDPIKRNLGSVFNRSVYLRILFYRLLDILLLRAWHIKKELKKWKNLNLEEKYILDAGSGFGQYTFYLSNLSSSYQIVAVDVKKEQIEDCNSFFDRINKSDRVEFREEDLTRYQSKDTFNLILSVDVMEHIEDDVTVFKNFYESLKPGGMVLINTPSDQGGSDVHDNDEHSFIDEHVRNGYNIGEIETKLKDSGFLKTEVYYTYGIPGSISWKLSLKYPILMLNTSKLFFILLPVYYLLTFPFCILLNYLDVGLKHKKGTGLIVKAWK